MFHVGYRRMVKGHPGSNQVVTGYAILFLTVLIFYWRSDIIGDILVAVTGVPNGDLVFKLNNVLKIKTTARHKYNTKIKYTVADVLFIP